MRIKIAVLVPLLAPELAKDWDYVQFCLNRTLRSILNNDSVDLLIYVMCQTRPDAMIEDRRIVFVKSENPIPENREAQGNDKAVKLAEGMRAASEFNPHYVMFADADDLISRHLFKYVVENPGHDAYCLDCGYEWRDGAKKLAIKTHFHRFCGTSFILKYKVDLFPAWLGHDPDVQWIGEGSHTSRVEIMGVHNFAIHHINEPKVIYVSGGQDQLMDRRKRLRRKLKDAVYSIWRNRAINESLIHEFSIR